MTEVDMGRGDREVNNGSISTLLMKVPQASTYL